MAKRFTDTEKWKKPFIRGLEAAYKLLWFYILDDCSHCGIWQCDFEVARLRIGENVTREKALEVFGDRIFEFDNKEKWFIVDFIKFQYGELNPQNRAHKSVILQLDKYGLYKKGLLYPFGGYKEEEEEKEKEKEKIELPACYLNDPAFEKCFEEFKHYRKEIRKKLTTHSEQLILSKLQGLTKDSKEAIEVLNQSMLNGWTGIFSLNGRKTKKDRVETNIK